MVPANSDEPFLLALILLFQCWFFWLHMATLLVCFLFVSSKGSCCRFKAEQSFGTILCNDSGAVVLVSVRVRARAYFGVCMRVYIYMRTIRIITWVGLIFVRVRERGERGEWTCQRAHVRAQVRPLVRTRPFTRMLAGFSTRTLTRSYRYVRSYARPSPRSFALVPPTFTFS